MSFEEQWSHRWVLVGKLIRTYTDIKNTKTLNLPADPVSKMASELLQRAINGDSQDSICSTLQDHCKNIHVDQLEPLRAIFGHVEGALIEMWQKKESTSAPTNIIATDWQIMNVLAKGEGELVPTRQLIAELQISDGYLYRRLRFLHGLGLVKSVSRKGSTLTAYGSRLFP